MRLQERHVNHHPHPPSCPTNSIHHVFSGHEGVQGRVGAARVKSRPSQRSWAARRVNQLRVPTVQKCDKFWTYLRTRLSWHSRLPARTLPVPLLEVNAGTGRRTEDPARESRKAKAISTKRFHEKRDFMKNHPLSKKSLSRQVQQHKSGHFSQSIETPTPASRTEDPEVVLTTEARWPLDPSRVNLQNSVSCRNLLETNSSSAINTHFPSSHTHHEYCDSIFRDAVRTTPPTA